MSLRVSCIGIEQNISGIRISWHISDSDCYKVCIRSFDCSPTATCRIIEIKIRFCIGSVIKNLFSIVRHYAEKFDIAPTVIRKFVDNINSSSTRSSSVSI